ncbi:hypothetical protein OB905_13920 [Halobacteria archaeon AArc-dxtr1]|nr:hypothetical protein [Halobacteria archaeon AArc-dxtr1]
MAPQTDPEREHATEGTNRRRVLQGIGAAGVATAVTGAAGADGQPGQWSQSAADVAAQDGEELPTGSQFWSFNELLDEDYTNADLIHLSADADLHSYEPYMIDDEEEMLEAQEETGVYMSSAHEDMEEIEDDPEGMAELYEQFAHDGRNPPLIEPFEDEETWETEESVVEFAERCNTLADEMADHDFQFGYHNHEHEFRYLDDGDERAYDVFIEELEEDVYVQLDVAWVLAGVDRPDPIHYITEYGDKIESLHMKNWQAEAGTRTEGEEGTGELTEIHEGDISMQAIAAAARNASEIDHLVYEYDNSPQPYDSFEYAGYWLNRVNAAWEPDGVCAIEGADVHPAIIHEPDEELVEEEEEEEEAEEEEEEEEEAEEEEEEEEEAEEEEEEEEEAEEEEEEEADE